MIFSILIVFAVLCQVGISYWSFYFIQKGEFVLGFSLFLTVPVLALLLVYAYILFRKGGSGQNKSGSEP
jgi:uncharacterized membrane protein